MTEQNKIRLLGLALVVLALAAFFPAIFNGFVWDDDSLLTNNQNVRTLAGLARCWIDPTANLDFYPMTYTSWWVEYKLWGYNPAGYHAVNMVMHGCNAVLLFAILRMLGFRGAWMIAALFAVHPIQVESVVWIAERKNTLSGLFYFASAWCFLRYWIGRNPSIPVKPGHCDARVLESTQNDTSHSTQAPPGMAMPGLYKNQKYAAVLYALSLLLFVLAMLAKPLVMTLAAALVAVMWWKRGGRFVARDVALAAPYFLLAIPMAALTIWVQQHHVGARSEEHTLTLVERVLVAGRVLGFYVYKLLLPAELSFAYPRWNIDAGAAWQWAFPLAACAAVLGAWLFRRRIGVGLFAALLFFIATLSPALGFINVYWHRYYFVADHMLYLAMIAIAAIVVHASLRANDWMNGAIESPVRPAHKLLGVAAVLTLIALSFNYSKAYRDQSTLWLDAIEKNHDAWIAHNNLGLIYQAQGNIPDALARFADAAKLGPGVIENRMNYGTLLLEVDQAEASLVEFKAAAALFETRGKITGASAKPDARRGEPTLLMGKAQRRLGLQNEAGFSFNSAAAIYRETLAINNRNIIGWYGLGRAEQALGRHDEAIKAFNVLLAGDPTMRGEMLGLIGVSHLASGREAEGVNFLSAALRESPANFDAGTRLVFALAASNADAVRNGRAAVALARQLCEQVGGQSPQYVMCVAALSAASAEAGDFEYAAKSGRAIADLAEKTWGSQTLPALLRARARQFEERKPLRLRGADWLW